MKILVVGAGLSGCTIARLLIDGGHEVSIIEKEPYVGGLCITRVNNDGLKYEPYGARTFHTNKDAVRYFVQRFDEFNGYTHRKGMIINNKLFPFPITRCAINDLAERSQILQELDTLPKEIDKTNFETAAISIFGNILYNYFIKNYTQKMWGCAPCELTADWAPKRLELGEDGHDELFRNQWQGLPKKGYSLLLEEMIKGIPLLLNTQDFDNDNYDLVISSAPIDKTMDFKYGKLQYRSLKFYHSRDELWEKDIYGTINLPQHPVYIRKCNFKVLYKVESAHNWIQYQEPTEADESNLPMYPVNTRPNLAVFDKYLKDISSTNIFPFGRLGLFKYLDMDKAVQLGFELKPIIVKYLLLSPEERYLNIKAVIERY